jgi:hypothetical protein
MKKKFLLLLLACLFLQGVIFAEAEKKKLYVSKITATKDVSDSIQKSVGNRVKMAILEKYAKSYYGSDSQEYKNILMAVRPVSELIPRKLAKDFGPLDFKQIRQWWLNRDVSRQYANRQMARIVRAVKWLVSEGILPPAIYQAIKCVSPLTKGHCKAREATPVAPVSDVKVNAMGPTCLASSLIWYVLSV